MLFSSCELTYWLLFMLTWPTLPCTEPWKREKYAINWSNDYYDTVYSLKLQSIDVKNILYNTTFSYIKYKCTYSPNNHLWHSTNVISNYFSKEHSYTSFCQGLSTKNTTSIILTGKCLETFFAFIIFWYYERNPSGF